MISDKNYIDSKTLSTKGLRFGKSTHELTQVNCTQG